MPTILERIAESLEAVARDELWNSPGIASGEVKGRFEALRQAARIVRENAETEDQSRQRFESWMLSCGAARHFLERYDSGGYRDNDTHVSWQAWQASQTFTEVNHGDTSSDGRDDHGTSRSG